MGARQDPSGPVRVHQGSSGPLRVRQGPSAHQGLSGPIRARQSSGPIRARQGLSRSVRAHQDPSGPVRAPQGPSGPIRAGQSSSGEDCPEKLIWLGSVGAGSSGRPRHKLIESILQDCGLYRRQQSKKLQRRVTDVSARLPELNDQMPNPPVMDERLHDLHFVQRIRNKWGGGVGGRGRGLEAGILLTGPPPALFQSLPPLLPFLHTYVPLKKPLRRGFLRRKPIRKRLLRKRLLRT